MYILIGADMVPTESNIAQYTAGKMKELITDDLIDLFKNAHFRIINLEVPLYDAYTPIMKCGPNLVAPVDSINGYEALNIDLVTIGNNHILDQGDKGLFSTLQTLTKSGIDHVGGGEKLEDALKPYVFRFAGKTIGVYACCEHEFSTASEMSPGANPFDPLYSFDHVDELKRDTDYVIVLYHGGKEHYRYPSPQLQRVCRRFAEKGADLIICQHSHCIGAEEKYLASTIVYGQGNFLFDRSDSEYWKTGLIVRLDDELNVTYIPIVKRGNGVALARKDESNKILEEFRNRSESINTPGYIQEKYDEFAMQMIDYYLRTFKGRESLLFRLINKLSTGRVGKHDLKMRYDEDEVLHILNYVKCEAHSELILRGLELRDNGR